MSAIPSETGLAGKPILAEDTRAARDDELASPTLGEKSQQGWRNVIDQHLIEWGRDTGMLQDDDFVPPSSEIVSLACQVAMACRDEGWSPPTRVVPDGEGGISFERDAGACFESLNVLRDGTVELLVFRDCKLIRRNLLA